MQAAPALLLVVPPNKQKRAALLCYENIIVKIQHIL